MKIGDSVKVQYPYPLEGKIELIAGNNPLEYSLIGIRLEPQGSLVSISEQWVTELNGQGYDPMSRWFIINTIKKF